MRLIDADKIDYIMEDDKNPSFLDYVRRPHIADEPTVKAIPIEWIEEKLEWLKESDWTGYVVIKTLLQEWEKENEENI